MAWNEVGNLTGPAGPQGPKGPAGASAPKYYGVLRWGNLSWYNPPGSQFHLMLATSGPRLYVHKDVGGVAQIFGAYARLYIPVSGLWLLSATQTWGNVATDKGVGLGKSITDGASGMELWRDFNGFAHGVTSRVTYLSAGTYLYPWTWNGVNSGMSFADRGLYSEYSAVLVQPE